MKTKFADLLMMFLLAFGLSSTALADPPQGRSRGKEKKFEKFDRRDDDCFDCSDDRWRRRGKSKKDDKFINGHDARDGRFDGRGPKVRSRRLPPPRRR